MAKAIPSRDEDYSLWYNELVKKADDVSYNNENEKIKFWGTPKSEITYNCRDIVIVSS